MCFGLTSWWDVGFLSIASPYSILPSCLFVGNSHIATNVLQRFVNLCCL